MNYSVLLTLVKNDHKLYLVSELFLVSLYTVKKNIFLRFVITTFFLLLNQLK